MNGSNVRAALAELKAGRMLVVTDAVDRENEGDLVVAAEHATPDVINFLVTHGRGLVCVPMRPERLEALDLPLMVADNTTPHGTAFTVPVDAREGTTTGISAYERALTIAALVDPATRPADLLRPGHVFPLRAHPGGVLARPGHTEAAVDLARMAGCYPAGVVCEILDDDGRMARGPSLAAFAARHGLMCLAIDELVRYLAGEAGEASAAGEAGAPTSSPTLTLAVTPAPAPVPTSTSSPERAVAVKATPVASTTAVRPPYARTAPNAQALLHAGGADGAGS